MGQLGSGMQVSASFQTIPRPVSRLRLGLWLWQITLYTLAHGGGSGSGKCPTLPGRASGHVKLACAPVFVAV